MNREAVQNFVSAGQLPPELISLRRFRADLGVVPSTLWRWIQRGWLDQPIDIGGRKYLTADMIRRFKGRAAHGEFAGKTKPPRSKSLTLQVGASIQPKTSPAGEHGGEGVGIAAGAAQVQSIAPGKF